MNNINTIVKAAGIEVITVGFDIGTSGTARVLQNAGIDIEVVRKLQEGRPNLLDKMANGEVQLIFNTPSGKGARTDEGRIRAAAVQLGVPCITTLSAAEAAVLAMEALRNEDMGVQALQDRFPTGQPRLTPAST